MKDGADKAASFPCKTRPQWLEKAQAAFCVYTDAFICPCSDCGISRIKAAFGSGSMWVHGEGAGVRPGGFPLASKGSLAEKPAHSWQSPCCLAAVTRGHGQSALVMPHPRIPLPQE